MRVWAARGAFPVGAVLGVAGLAAGLAVGMLHLDKLPVTLCTFKRWTGFPCATCGSTRAFAHLYQLDLAGALAQNPLAVAGVAALAAWSIADLLLLARGRALSVSVTDGEARVLRASVIVALAVNWAYLIASGR